MDPKNNVVAHLDRGRIEFDLLASSWVSISMRPSSTALKSAPTLKMSSGHLEKPSGPAWVWIQAGLEEIL